MFLVLLSFIFAAARRAQASYAQLLWAFGKGPTWRIALFTGGARDGLQAALQHVAAFTSWRRTREGMPGKLPVHMWLVNIADFTPDAVPGWEVAMQATVPKVSLKELPGPASQHLTVHAESVPESGDKFRLLLGGNTWPLREACAQLQVDGASMQGAYYRFTPPLHMENEADLTLLQGLADLVSNTYFSCKFATTLPQKTLEHLSRTFKSAAA